MIARRRNEYQTRATLSEDAFNSRISRLCSFESWSEALRHNHLQEQTYP
jgi:hypothetical protein